MYKDDYSSRAYKIPVRRPENRDVAQEQTGELEPAAPVQKPAPLVRDEITLQKRDEIDWKALARRQQADMDNFRRRQTRRADDAIAAERERLLKKLLPVADNLTRALQHSNQDDVSLQKGVEIVYRQLMSLLQAEGVTPIEAIGQPFDPELHEAIAVTPANTEAGTIIDQIETGYKLKDKLLRPAKVVVAQ